MSSLQGKKILLGVSGSIAAYKSVFLLRLFKKAGAEVKVVTTPSVSHFVGELSFSSLSGHPVFSGLWEENWSAHVALGTWADVMVVAPATANTLAKMAHGLCDNALLAVYLAARCPVILAPAMDADMYLHPTTSRNLETLTSFGHHILPVGSGFLASGLEGPGRMREPEEILASTENLFLPGPLSGKKVLVTAGPTQEAIDPVRFLTNHSTGKMGYAIAREAAMMGAEVTLVSGPTALKPPEKVSTLHVSSVQEMYDAVHAVAAEQDLVVMSAAVSDYAPLEVAPEKIKKKGEEMVLRLKKTVDILKSLGQSKPDGQVLVGFALETENELAHAMDKLKRKNLDMIVLNSLKDAGAGFGHDTNKVTLIDAMGGNVSLPLASKQQVAAQIMEKALSIMEAK